MQLKLSYVDIQEVFYKLDLDSGGSIEFDEFTQLFEDKWKVNLIKYPEKL